MSFDQRKMLVLSAWTATMITLGIIMTIETPSLWFAVACLAVIPAAIGNWLWNAPEPTLSQLIAKQRR